MTSPSVFSTSPLMLSGLILVMLGGAVGAGLRFLVGKLALVWLGPAFPWGTLAVNLIGGLAMGLLAGSLSRWAHGEGIRLLLAVGLLGGFTTFSAFSLEVALMIERSQWLTAASYTSASVAGSVLALFAGLWLMRASA